MHAYATTNLTGLHVHVAMSSIQGAMGRCVMNDQQARAVLQKQHVLDSAMCTSQRLAQQGGAWDWEPVPLVCVCQHSGWSSDPGAQARPASKGRAPDLCL